MDGAIECNGDGPIAIVLIANVRQELAVVPRLI